MIRSYVDIARISGVRLFSALMLLLGLFVSPGDPALAAPAISVPYISQYQGLLSPINFDNVDCGPASVAMVLRYYGQGAGVSDPALVSGVRAAAGGQEDTTFAQLEAALRHYGITYSGISNALPSQPDAKMAGLRSAVDAGQPVIVLVNGAGLGRGSTYGDHWIVVTGFSDDGQTVYVNDPDSQDPRGRIGWIKGGRIALSYATFRNAAATSGSATLGLVESSSSPMGQALRR